MNNKESLKGPSLETSDSPDKLVFLLHGYGDNADNFLPLAQYLNNTQKNRLLFRLQVSFFEDFF